MVSPSSVVAAQDGHEAAPFYLGLMYEDGDGVKHRVDKVGPGPHDLNL